MPADPKSDTPTILRLAVPSPLRRYFDYLPPESSDPAQIRQLQPGMRLLVPFGSRKLIGILAEVADNSNVEPARLRPAIAILDKEPLLPPALLKVLTWAADYYQHPPGEVYGSALPVMLRTLAPARPVMGWRALPVDAPVIPEPIRRAPRQQALLAWLRDNGPVAQPDCIEAGYDAALLRKLAGHGLIEQVPVNPPGARLAAAPKADCRSVSAPLIPNPDQAAAIDTIIQQLDGFASFLLDGVTGSGKTEVYLQVIADVLKRGRQALVLVPEIGLTPQNIQRFEQRFSCRVAGLHSGMSDSERLENWQAARQGQARIIIGTRSAVFTPLAQPGLIIVDEEHDLSFKQQDGFRYSARDLAIVRARHEQIPVILGSATPALETLHNAGIGKFTRLPLQSRAGLAELPGISLLDTTTDPLQEGFSPRLLNAIDTHLGRGNQVLVFINRRGFAPALYCRDCAWVFECDHCDAQLTVHQTPPHLCCHHCEFRAPLPASCPNCRGKHMATRGMGTQKTEKHLMDRFPGVPVIRMDRDVVRRKHGLRDILEEMGKGAPCILVGTQMLVKGHHFPNVTLVAVLDADAGLFSADFRGQELMVQQLMQVSGRAGRQSQAGEVVIQTRHAAHYLLQTLVGHDYRPLADHLLTERRTAGMPPFSHLVLFRAEARDTRSPILLLNRFRELFEAEMRSNPSAALGIHGPLPAPMERKAGRYRAQLLIKSADRSRLQRILSLLMPRLEQFKLARDLRWSVDVDPLDLI